MEVLTGLIELGKILAALIVFGLLFYAYNWCRELGLFDILNSIAIAVAGGAIIMTWPSKGFAWLIGLVMLYSGGYLCYIMIFNLLKHGSVNYGTSYSDPMDGKKKRYDKEGNVIGYEDKD